MTEQQSTRAETDSNSAGTTRRTYLKGALGMGTTIAAMPVLSGAASAHFPVADMGFDGAEETGWLYWERDESGEHGYAGVDSVRVYGTEPSNRDLLELLRQLVNRQN